MLRAIDVRVWTALAVAGSVLLLYRSMISHSIAQFAPYAWNKVSLDQVFDSYTEMVEVVLYPILALFAVSMILFFISRQLAPMCLNCRGTISRRWIGSVLFPDAGLNIPKHEAVAILGLMAYPFLGYIVASIRGGMLSPRFVIPVCFGFAIAATLVASRLFAELPYAGAVMLCFCLAWFVARESVVAYGYEEQKQSFFNVLQDLPQAEAHFAPDVPIAIPDPLLALTLQHYAPRPVADRVVFPVDFPAIRHYRHDDSPEENLWAGRGFLYTLPILPLASFQQTAGKYLVIAGEGNWLIQDLSAHRYSMQQLPIDTRTQAIGGFTPLAHGTPEFFSAAGDAVPVSPSSKDLFPKPFRVEGNLPESKFALPGEASQE
jgi:hypothetical protein